MSDIVPDIVAFIRARLDEDVRKAERANTLSPAPWAAIMDPTGPDMTVVDANGTPLHHVDGGPIIDPHVGRHMVHHDPDRVLRGVEAKRRFLEILDATRTPDRPEWMDAATYQRSRASADIWVSHAHALMAREWSDHEDYQEEEWRP